MLAVITLLSAAVACGPTEKDNGPDRLILADPAVTKRKCAPGAAAEAEGRFLGILRDVSYYPAVMASGRMTLDTEDGRKLVFSASG